MKGSACITSNIFECFFITSQLLILVMWIWGELWFMLLFGGGIKYDSGHAPDKLDEIDQNTLNCIYSLCSITTVTSLLQNTTSIYTQTHLLYNHLQYEYIIYYNITINIYIVYFSTIYTKLPQSFILPQYHISWKYHHVHVQACVMVKKQEVCIVSYNMKWKSF